MRILISGGSGFIGKTLIEGLSKKYIIFSPFHKELDLLDAGRVNKYIKTNKIDVVIHCAIKGGPNVLSETVKMHSNILNNIQRLKKFIYFGSGAEYAKIRTLLKVSEKEIGEKIPRDDYGLAKLTCNDMSRQYKKIINLRIFGIYGENENYLQAFVSNSIVKNLLGLPIEINQNVKFDYLFAGDLIPIVEHFLKHNAKYSDYNVTPVRSITLKEIAQIINEISDKPSKVKFLHKGMNLTYTGSNKRLLTEVKNFKFTPYKIGIKIVYEFRKKNVEKLDKKAIIQDRYLAHLKNNEASKKLSK